MVISTAPRRRSSLAALSSFPGFVVRQHGEPLELLGIEGANAYTVHACDGTPVFTARERRGGFLGEVTRQLGGHTANGFTLDVADLRGRPVLRLDHPASLWRQRVAVRSGSGRLLGTLEEELALFSKRMLVRSADGRPTMAMTSTVGSPWTHAFERARPDRRERLATVHERWDGLGRALFTDADTFTLAFESSTLHADERGLLLAAALFVDLVWFETNAAD